MNKLLEAEHLTVSYYTYAGIVQAVRDISFSIDRNQAIAIVGESGCGKSVTAKALMGLIERPGRIEEGSILRFNGEILKHEDENTWREYRGRHVSMIFQDALAALNPTMKIGSQMTEGLENHTKCSRSERERKAADMLGRVGIASPKRCMRMYPHELSGGMRQRVMIASALLTNPRLLIADEPTTALDVTVQAQILSLMKELKRQSEMSVILITHDLGVVADFAEEIMVMYAGKIIESGSREDIYYDPRHPYTQALLRAAARLSSDKSRKLSTIPGTVPNMIHPPKGCAFCNRCPHARRLCQKLSPPHQVIKEGHSVSCWMHVPEVKAFLEKEAQ